MERYKCRMDKIVRIALAEIIIFVCIDYILGLLSKTRVLQYYYMNIRCWLINMEDILLLIIIATLFCLLITNKYEVMTTEELFEKFTSNSFTEEELSSLHEKCKNIKGWDVQEEPYRHINPASKDNWLKDCPKKLREELDKLWQLD